MPRAFLIKKANKGTKKNSQNQEISPTNVENEETGVIDMELGQDNLEPHQNIGGKLTVHNLKHSVNV